MSRAVFSIIISSMHKTLKNEQQGFTLVEMLVTIVVLGIAVVGIASLYYSMQVVQAQSQHLDLAVRAARSEIENLRNNGYNNLVSGGNINFTSSLPNNLPKDRSGTVVVSQPVSGLVQVDVTISYTDHGKAQFVKLTSDIGVIGIGQGQ